MSISVAEKAEVVKDTQQLFGLEANDTGSAEVQVAILTRRISNLTGHFKVHKKDNHSRHGLKKLVDARRSMLDYVKRISVDRYRKLIEALGIRR